MIQRLFNFIFKLLSAVRCYGIVQTGPRTVIYLYRLRMSLYSTRRLCFLVFLYLLRSAVTDRPERGGGGGGVQWLPKKTGRRAIRMGGVGDGGNGGGGGSDRGRRTQSSIKRQRGTVRTFRVWRCTFGAFRTQYTHDICPVPRFIIIFSLLLFAVHLLYHTKS